MMLSLSACATVQWYGQALHGQLSLLSQREDIEQLIAHPETAPELRKKLALTLEIRAFASEQLGLPDNDSYTDYVELGRDAVLWNVIAVPEFSLQPKTWCYPLVGCLAYRGWFKRERAEREADTLAASGFDTRVSPVPAYSTLGKLEDPLTSAMLRWDEATLAGLIFHELAHQRVFVSGETAFNEAYATSVERVGVERWFTYRNEPDKLKAWQMRLEAHQQLVDWLLQTRMRLADVYAIDTEHEILGADILTAAKQVGFSQLRAEYRDWAVRRGQDPFAAFFDRPLNNADLALVSTYEAGVHAFDALLAKYAQDLEDFHLAVEKLAQAGSDERADFLNK
ncbi:MAG: aminopeptidase [Pseudomonadota bacterium]